MLKVKPSFDRECIIIDYKLGEGKYTGLLGSFICRPLINHDTYMSIDQDEDIYGRSGKSSSESTVYIKGTALVYLI